MYKFFISILVKRYDSGVLENCVEYSSLNTVVNKKYYRKYEECELKSKLLLPVEYPWMQT